MIQNNRFGELLRKYRQACNDPEHPGRRLSQERLGQLLGQELKFKGSGYSGAAISDWEHGKSKIHQDQWPLLIALIKILHRLGGLKTLLEANEFLEAGNYRALNPDERSEILSGETFDEAYEIPTHEPEGRQSNIGFLLEKIFSLSSGEFRKLVIEAEEGPSPAWPRVLAAVLRRATDHWSRLNLIQLLFWLLTWLITWSLIAPSFRLPFTSQESAKIALRVYIVGTFLTPLLIGVLTDTRKNKFWMERNLASAPMTHLYTYQGAGIGFHLGYFAVFAINLLAYYIHLRIALWFEVMEIAFILFWGYLGARLVPYNLWRAYGRLALADGWIFFVFLLIGPFWNFFFFELYDFLFTSRGGGLTFICIISLFILIISWWYSRKA